MEDDFLDINGGFDPNEPGIDMPGIDEPGKFGGSHISIFDSGFDEDHPRPTIDQLQNAGFSHQMAVKIASGYGEQHSYSDRELYHCLYECEDPVQAYNDMMDDKVHAAIDRSNALIDEIEAKYSLGSSTGVDDSDSIYNEEDNHQDDHESDDDKELGSCDCRSECKYNTGHSYKYADYGYSD